MQIGCGYSRAPPYAFKMTVLARMNALQAHMQFGIRTHSSVLRVGAVGWWSCGAGPQGEVRCLRRGHPRHAAVSSFINRRAELGRVDILAARTLVRVSVCVVGWAMELRRESRGAVEEGIRFDNQKKKALRGLDL